MDRTPSQKPSPRPSRSTGERRAGAGRQHLIREADDHRLRQVQPAMLEPRPRRGRSPAFGSGPVPRFGIADTEHDEQLRPLNWNLLTGDEAEAEWLDLNAWVNWLRATYGLPPTVIPPYWHRHDELVWELSALHLHWLNSYDPDGSPSGPIAWHRDFADARNRLREWVSTSGPDSTATEPPGRPLGPASRPASRRRGRDRGPRRRLRAVRARRRRRATPDRGRGSAPRPRSRDPSPPRPASCPQVVGIARFADARPAVAVMERSRTGSAQTEESVHVARPRGHSRRGPLLRRCAR